MRTFLSIVTVLLWAIWIGALVALFVYVPALFSAGRPIASQSAPILFHTFERMQLFLAPAALLALVLWSMVQRSRALVAGLVLQLLAILGGAISTFLVTPKMQALRLAGHSGDPEFMRLHGYSMAVYSGQALLLLAAGILIVLALRSPARSTLPGAPTA